MLAKLVPKIRYPATVGLPIGNGVLPCWVAPDPSTRGSTQARDKTPAPPMVGVSQCVRSEPRTGR